MIMVEDRSSQDQDATQHLPKITGHSGDVDPGPAHGAWWGRYYLATIEVRGHAIALFDHLTDCLWLEVSLYSVEPWMPCGLITSLSSSAECRVHLARVADREGRTILRPDDADLKVQILHNALARLGVTQR